jgi:hypothetical protein
MKAKVALTLTAIFLFCIFVSNLRTESIHANGDGQVEQANAKNLQSPGMPASALENGAPKQASLFANAHAEPLLLALFGVVLLWVGTFINNFMLSKRVRAKSMPGVAGEE